MVMSYGDVRDIGHLVEGVVERDPMSDDFVLRIQEKDGSVRIFDVQKVLAGYEGQEVRLILAPFEAIERLANLVEQAG